MELRHFDLNLLVAFDWLMQEQNVSRAAERMFVSQSAMSHTLQRLRQQLDDPLLVKTPSGMKPTERAMALIEPVRAVLREVESLIRQPEVFDPARSQRRFVMAATDYMDFLLIPPLIERIAQEAPGIDIHVKRTDLPFPEKELETGELDIVLGFEAILKPAGYLTSRKLFDDRMTCLLRRDHPIIQGDKISLDDYITLKHMLISRTGTRTGVIDDWLAERGLERRIALIVPHFLSAPFIVAKTDMLLSLPLRIAEQFVRLAPLRVLPVPIELPSYDLVMIWHPLRENDSAHRWLREQIWAVCQGLDEQTA
ncbi:MAG TPA: LysR family transcriptional regulator [Anaerolineaceae bacterium]|nr:LysR family transcriptional regulator [Anaerolineaceae bacterium]